MNGDNRNNYGSDGSQEHIHEQDRSELYNKGALAESSSIKSIDLKKFVPDFIDAFRRMYTIPVTLALVFILLAMLYGKMFFNPKFSASATFTINVEDESSNTSSEYATVNYGQRLSETFPYILSSDAMINLIKQDLGSTAISATVKASAIGETNLFSITVEASAPQTAYHVLKSAIKNYTKISDFVIGKSVLTQISEPEIPSKPSNELSYKMQFVAGAAIGFVIGLAVITITVLARNTIRDTDDIKKLLNIKSLGNIPSYGHRSKQGEAFIGISDPKTPKDFADSIRLLRSRTEKVCSESGYKVVLISGSMPGEGKTTVASNLAMALALSGKKTALLDCDIRKPSALAEITKDTEKGIVEYLNGDASIDEIISHPYENLIIINAKEPSDEAADLLGSDRMSALIDELKKVTDFVVIDTPPAALIADGVVLADYADCIIYVIRQDYTKKSRILDGISNISTGKAEFLGYVLNTAYSSDGRGYGYGGYGYGGYGRYGKYGKYGSYGSYGRYGRYGSYGKYGRYGSYGRYGRYSRYGNYGKYSRYGSYGRGGKYGSYNRYGSYGNYGDKK